MEAFCDHQNAAGSGGWKGTNAAAIINYVSSKNILFKNNLDLYCERMLFIYIFTKYTNNFR